LYSTISDCIISENIREINRGDFMNSLRGYKKKAAALTAAGTLLLGISQVPASAAVTGDDAFSNLTWTELFSDTLQNPTGVIQSICLTDQYIITIENAADDPTKPDTVSAYYRNSTDAAGNPVQQYSLAKRVSDTDWEHGNGMTYNPKTNQIYVAPYTALNSENTGCVLVMDPETLEMTGRIKITDGFNVLGIQYLPDTDQYLILTNGTTNYCMLLFDSNFKQLENYGSVNTAPGTNYQDFAVTGDYALLLPLTYNMGIGDYLNIYSITRKTVISQNLINYPADYGVTEPEDLCELEPGVFLVPVTAGDSSGAKNSVHFLTTTVPSVFTVTTTAHDGTITETSGPLNRGDSYTVEYSPNENAELRSITVDGKEIDATANATSYTFENIQGDHTIDVNYKTVIVDENDTVTNAGNDVTSASAENVLSTSGEAGLDEAPSAAAADTEKTSKKSPLAVLPLIIALLAIAGGFGALYMRIRAVRLERARRRDERRRRREQEAPNPEEEALFAQYAADVEADLQEKGSRYSIGSRRTGGASARSSRSREEEELLRNYADTGLTRDELSTADEILAEESEPSRRRHHHAQRNGSSAVLETFLGTIFETLGTIAGTITAALQSNRGSIPEDDEDFEYEDERPAARRRTRTAAGHSRYDENKFAEPKHSSHPYHQPESVSDSEDDIDDEILADFANLYDVESLRKKH